MHISAICSHSLYVILTKYPPVEYTVHLSSVQCGFYGLQIYSQTLGLQISHTLLTPLTTLIIIIIIIIRSYYGAPQPQELRSASQHKLQIKRSIKYIKMKKSVVIISVNTVIQSGTVNKLSLSVRDVNWKKVAGGTSSNCERTVSEACPCPPHHEVAAW